MSTYEHVLFEAWIHGMITDNEFALAWQLYNCDPAFEIERAVRDLTR